MCFSVFFCKQKTAYEMRISDWSSDVCSSDLVGSGDAGIENALGVAEEALENRVTILNRSRDFARAKAKNVSDLMDAGENGAIDIRTETQPRLVEDGWMTLETPNGDERIACDVIVARLGPVAPSAFVEARGIEFSGPERGALPKPSPNVWAIGRASCREK